MLVQFSLLLCADLGNWTFSDRHISYRQLSYCPAGLDRDRIEAHKMAWALGRTCNGHVWFGLTFVIRKKVVRKYVEAPKLTIDSNFCLDVCHCSAGHDGDEDVGSVGQPLQHLLGLFRHESQVRMLDDRRQGSVVVKEKSENGLKLTKESFGWF